MSGPVQPPLTVETVDGTTSGRPITTIKVTNGDLTVSGSVATIDTSGGGGGGGTVTSVSTSQAFITITNPTTTPSISIGNASGAATGVLTASDFNTFDAKQDTITLTTAGSTGVATFAADTLNIPNYTTPQASYITLGTDAGLTNERVLTAGTGISFTDTGAGGTLTVEATGGGAIGGSITSTQVARGATTANEIEGDNGLLFDGTSFTVNTLSADDPVINISSNTKSVSLQCETSQTLSIKGGSNKFVFDASSSSSGITFPDGTTQTTASTGSGGNEFNLELPGTDINSGNNDLYMISRMPGWGSNSPSASSLNSDANPKFWPWISPVTGDLTCCIDVTFDGTGTLGIAIYSDSNGSPNSKIGGNYTYVFGTSGTGVKQLTPASTVSVTRGTQYWIGVVETSIGNGAIRSESGNEAYTSIPRFSGTSSFSSVTVAGTELSSSSNTLPATVTVANLGSTTAGQPRWGGRFS